jgi:hypothetical protein
VIDVATFPGLPTTNNSAQITQRVVLMAQVKCESEPEKLMEGCGVRLLIHVRNITRLPGQHQFSPVSDFASRNESKGFFFSMYFF